MSYYKVLRNVICESGYTYQQIVDECKKRGKNLDKAYLSKLMNNKLPAPTEELSRIIADICNVDERKLVLEGYLDKAPKEIREALLSVKSMMYMYTTNLFENKADSKLYEQMQEKLQEEPLSDFVISLIDEKADAINFTDSGMELLKIGNDDVLYFNFRLEEPLSIPIEDNGMFPKILENSKVTLKLETKYNDFDILAVKLKDTEEIIARFALINNDEITLKPLNNQYETLKYKLNDVTILGKVVKVITEI